MPVTKLGRLVAANKIASLEEIYLFSIPIKEYQIIDHFIKDDLKEEVMKIMPVQKQTSAGQRTRFKAFMLVGDKKGHVGLGVKCSKEVANAIKGASIAARLNVIPVRLGYWGGRFGAPHTIPGKITGKCGSCRFRLIPAPRGTGLVAARGPKKVLEFAGVTDVYSSTRGHTATLGNLIKACFQALKDGYSFLTPDLWAPTEFQQTLQQKHTDFLKDNAKGKKA